MITVIRAKRPKRKSRRGDMHVTPNVGPEHETDSDCWCSPFIDYVAPRTGACVWVHRDHN